MQPHSRPDDATATACVAAVIRPGPPNVARSHGSLERLPWAAVRCPMFCTLTSYYSMVPDIEGENRCGENSPVSGSVARVRPIAEAPFRFPKDSARARRTAQSRARSGDDHQAMHPGTSGDHGIFDQGAGTAMPEPCPLAECGGIHGEQVVGEKHRIEPGFQFPGLGHILFPSQFNPRLSLSDRHHGQKQVIGSHTLKPGNDGWMRTGPSQFKYDSGVEQIHRITRSWEMDGDEAAAVAASACPCVLRAPATVP